jgi:hypothetical protein
VADLFTPLVVIPTAWWVVAGVAPLRGRVLAALLLISAVWIEAHGIHLAANAIGDVFDAGRPRDAFYATDAGPLDHFLDEDLSHWAWHAAWVALTLLMVVVASRPATASATPGPHPATPTSTSTGSLGVIAVAGVIHGLAFFLVTAEGGTAALGIAASIVFALWSGGRIRAGNRSPVLTFVLVGSVVTLAVDAVWAASHGGQLVEPCSVLGC